MKSSLKFILIVILLVVLGGLGWMIYARIQSLEKTEGGPEGSQPVPVETAEIETGTITLRRTFSGTLEAPSRFIVAPKVSGRVEHLHVDLADTVKRGQIVVELDNEEYVQAVNGAEADLAVARANLTEAKNALEIASRELMRIETLRERGVASESQLDAAKADQLAKEAELEVARAQVTRAEASLQTARIRLGYTTIAADWSGGDEGRVVGRRYVNAGDTVSANAAILSIIELDPVMGVIFITEKDYARLQPGQTVALRTDAYPDRTFEGTIARIAPVFQADSRQARVELTVPNTEQLLKPGMFIRATIILEQIQGATIVPAQAVTRRDDRDGIFLVDEQTMTARWQEVKKGIREGDRIQLLDEGLSGQVITLGQQMVDDGSAITIPNGDTVENGDGSAPGAKAVE